MFPMLDISFVGALKSKLHISQWTSERAIFFKNSSSVKCLSGNQCKPHCNVLLTIVSLQAISGWFLKLFIF